MFTRIRHFFFPPKHIPTIDMKIRYLFNEWKVEQLSISKQSHRYRCGSRFYIKDGKWYYDDFDQSEFCIYVWELAQDYVREATESEIYQYDLFEKIQKALDI